MCGRFVQDFLIENLNNYYKIKNRCELKSNYNVTPEATIPVIVHSRKTNENEVQLLKWGFIPFWVKDPESFSKPINARLETIDEKPSFTDSFHSRRCIIPASGFYEWNKHTKQPFYIKPRHGLFSFAAIWDRFINAQDELILTCAIITTKASPALAVIHDRMPAMLSENEIKLWIDPKTDIINLKSKLNFIDDNNIEYWPVDKEVNNSHNNDSSLIEKLTETF